MSIQKDTRQRMSLGDDEAESVAEAPLARSHGFAESDEPAGRRVPADLSAAIRNSVFGRPEPIAPSMGDPEVATSSGVIGRAVTGGSTRPRFGSAHRETRTILFPDSAEPRTKVKVPVATIARTAGVEAARRRRGTIVLASLFTLSLAGSIALTALSLGDTAEADTNVAEPTVQGTFQIPTTAGVAQPPTTLSASTVLAPPTTVPPTTGPPTTVPPTTVPPTTVPPTTVPSTTVPPTTVASTTVPPTTVPPTTVASTTTRRPTTRPPTTRRPTTQPTTQPTTAPTLPDVTFSQPTWAPTTVPAP